MRDRTLRTVLTAFTITVCLLLLSTWACVRILSGVRAYVGGEGLYSKAQKNAVYFLELYVQTRDEQWFRKFQDALRVPEGDRDARLALDQPHPGLNAARRGFIGGGNSPDDVDDLIFVFRRMRRTPYVSAAVNIWTEADAEIARLRRLGDRIHSEQPGRTDASLEIEALNQRMTLLEDRFSATLGAGARSTSTSLLAAIALLSIALWATGAVTFRRLLLAFARERERLLAIISNAPLGILLLDAPDGHIRIGNAQAWQLLGGPSETLPRGLAEQVAAGALEGTVMRPQNIEWTRPDTTKVWLRMSGAPIRRGGRVAGAVMILYDITEERRIEDAMLRQSQQLARSNADLEHFAYTTSHDLQEPLRNIGIFSQLLAKRYGGSLDMEADHIIGVITSSVERMSALIRDLLAYSRVKNIDAAPMDAVNLNDALDWARSNLRAKILESQALIETENLPIVRGDSVQLVQVFQNLIDNAIKYAGAKKPRIQISAEKAGDEWAVTVRDEGVGIDPQHHQQIFGIFKRLHGREVPGTGIGLALVQRVVERHGGKIRVESTQGEGAAFIFTLPGSGTAERVGSGERVEAVN